MGSSLDPQFVAICPACGYPKLGDGPCALCMPTVALEVGQVPLAFGGAPDFTPAA